MAKIFEFEGKRYSFPDDTTTDEVFAFLNSISPPPSPAPEQAPEQQKVEPQQTGLMGALERGATNYLGFPTREEFEKTTSPLGAAAASGTEALIATPVVLAGAKMGMKLAPKHPLAQLAGGLIGGVGGGLATSYGLGKAEEYSDEKLGTDIVATRQQQMKEHPTASTVGALAGGGLNPWMAPGLPKTVTEGVLGAGLMTGIGGAQRMAAGGEFFDPGHMLTDAAFGAFIQPTARGQRLLGQPTTVPRPKEADIRSEPPSVDTAISEIVTRTTQQIDKQTAYKDFIENKLVEAKVEAEKNPSKQYVVDNLQDTLARVNDDLTNLNRQLDTVKTEKTDTTTVTKDAVTDLQKLETEYIEARRRANELAAKQDEAIKLGRTSEVDMLDKQFEVAMEKRNQAKANLDKARGNEALVNQGYKLEDSALLATNRKGNLRDNNTAFNELVSKDGLTNVSNKALEESITYREKLREKYDKGVAKEILDGEISTLKAELQGRASVQKTQGDATTVPPPPKETIGEAPRGLPEAPLVDKEGRPLRTGEDTSVQVKGEVVKSGDIAEAFDPVKVSTWSDEAIANTIFRKEALLQDPNTAPSVKANLSKELDILYAEEGKRAFDYSQNISGNRTEMTTIAGLQDAVAAGGWRNGLVHIIDNLPSDDILSVVSKALLKNKWLSPNVVYKTLPEGKAGRYEHGTENIFLSKEAPNNATLLVHESVHRGSTNAILQWEVDKSLLTSRERKAVDRLKEIYDQLLTDPKMAGTKDTVMKNMQELLAYGTGYKPISSYLNTLYLKGEKVSVLRKLVNTVMDLLGLEPKARSAYTELMGIGKTLISEAKPIQTPMQAKAGLANQLTRANLPTILTDTQDSLLGLAEAGSLSDIGRKLSKIYSFSFGKGQLKEIWDNPVIRYVGTVVQRAESDAVAFKNQLLNGFDPNVAGPVGKRFISAKQYIANNSVRTTYKKLSDIDAANLAELNKRFLEERVSVDTLKAQMKDAGYKGDMFSFHLEQRIKQLTDAGVSPKVIEAYRAQQNALHLGWMKNNEMLGRQGTAVIPFRPDYYPAIRKGKFAVSVLANDALYHYEQFRTDIEAKLFIEKVNGYKGYTTKLEDIDLSREGIPNLDELTDFTLNMFNRLGIDPEATGLFNALDQMTTTGMKFGKHQLYRENISGYAGSQWFKSKAELGKDFKHAMFDWVDEQAAIRTKQQIKYDTERLLGETSVLEKTVPNTLNVARDIRDIAMNTMPEWKLATAFDKSVRGFSDGLVHNIAKLFGKEDYVPKISPADKTMGVASSMFYMTTLMNRAGFWASQVLTSPLSVRYMVRDETVPLASIANSLAKGTARTFGFVKYDKVTAEVMQRLINENNTLRPQLQNEMNTISWLDVNAHEKLGKVLRVITGQSPAEAADVFSRIWTANMMIEHYRGIGLKGIELVEAVANATDNTMVPYTRSSKAFWVEKSGMVGQAANPLLTFGTAQLGNLVSDIHYMAQKGTLRSALPALSTMLVGMLQGGAIGLPILVEYQFLRDMIVGYDPDYDWLPDPKVIMSQQPAVLERGVVSAATGLDIGSGMRWNPFLAKFFLEDNKSFIDVFPAVAFMGDVGKAVGMSLLDTTGMKTFTEAEKRKAYLKVVPFVGGKALVEATSFNLFDREYVPGSKSEAVVEQTPMETLSTFFGSSTVDRARKQNLQYITSQREKVVSGKQSKYVELIADAVALNGKNFDEGVEGLKKLGLNGEEISNLVLDRVKTYKTPLAARWLQGGEGPAALRKRLRTYELVGKELGLK